MEENTVESNSKKVESRNKKTIWNKFIGIFSSKSEKITKETLPMPNDKTMWVPDEKAPTCYNCQKQFSPIFLRKHHCRICGNVFCKDCSSKSVDGKYWGSKKEIKVCDYCHEMYKKLDETLVETTIGNTHNYIEDIDSIEDNMKNLKRETKLSEYCKNYKKETEEYYKFLQMDRKSEEQVKNDFDSYYDCLVKHFIEVVLRNEGLYEKWFDKIYELTKKTIASVNPSFKDLKDTMNINDYINIKTIQYRDNSLCKVIDGYAFQKNVTSKTMNSNIDNPRILLLDCGLDYARNNDKITSFDDLMTLEPAYFNIIMKKIELVEPTVILVNKNVSRKILESLTISNKISVVMNVKSSTLKKIARCTKTYVLPSTDLIDQQTILGTCKKFRVDKIKSSSKTANESLKANEFNLMVFEGCDYVLYNTIILSGPDIVELKLLKRLMKTILLAVRDLFLQKIFLYFFYCDLPDQWEDFHSRITISSGKNSSISNLSLSNNSQNMLLKNQPLINGFNPSPHFLITNLTESCQPREFTNGFDTCIFYDKSRLLNLVQLTMILGQNPSMNTQTFNVNSIHGDDKSSNISPGTFYTFGGEMAESEVLKKVNSICRGPDDLEFIFYCDKDLHDKPLGKLIIDLCHEADTRCDDCKKSKSSHIYYIYKKLGRLKIETVQNLCDKKDNINDVLQFINRNNTDFAKFNNLYRNDKSDKSVANNYNFDIYSYGVCKFCGISTPLIKLPRELFNFSVAMFFKFMLYNHELKIRTDKRPFNLLRETLARECHHNVNRDIHRIFITKLGTIKISYEDSPFHVIETSPMNEKTDSLTYTKLLENCCQTAKEKSMDVLSSLFNNFKVLVENMMDLAKQTDNSAVQIHCDKTIKIINKYVNITNEVINFVDNIFSLPKFEDYVKANVFIKKVYFRIVQIKLVQNWVRKIHRKVKITIQHLAKVKSMAQQIEKVIDKDTLSNNNTHTLNSPKNSIIMKEPSIHLKESLSNQSNPQTLQNPGNDSNLIFNNIAIGFCASSQKDAKESVTNNQVNVANNISSNGHQNNAGNIFQTPGVNANNSCIVNNNNNISVYSQLNNTCSDLEISHKDSSIFDNVDYKESYKSIVKEISYLDEFHTKYSSDHNEEDVGAIIAYTLGSDKYRDFISPNNKFKLIDIKCERKPRTVFDPISYNNENIRKEFKAFFANESADMTNITGVSEGKNAITEEEVQDTSLLFDQSKNTYQYQNLDNHKIYQQLETELLSDEKIHFTLLYSNSNTMNQLSSWNMPIEFLKKKTEVSHPLSIEKNKSLKEKFLVEINSLDVLKDSEKTNPIGNPNNSQINQMINTNQVANNTTSQVNVCPAIEGEEKLILQGDNIKATIEEFESIKKELKALREIANTNDKTKKFKKLEFIEEAILTPTEYEVIVYYPRQFEALRITYCATYEEFMLSVTFF